ncbi:MAG TPA: ABC transporter substrate-binding protein [Desulfuromonadaceae bacterium]
MSRVATVAVGCMLTAVFLAACHKKEEPRTPAAGGGDTVKIAFMGALTGDVAMFGKPSLEGMKMAADEINAKGGVLGKKIEIVEADNRGDKQEGAALAQKFVSRDNVVAILGDPTTGISKVVAPIAQKAQVVMLSAGATGPGVVELGDYIFRDTLLDSVAMPALVGYLTKELKFTRFALVTSDNNDYSFGLSQTFRDAVKGSNIQIVADEKIKDGDKDFSAQVTNIKASKPDAIFFSGYYTEGALLMKEARKQGLKVPMVGGDGISATTFLELGGDAVEGSIAYLGFSPEQATGETATFVANYKKRTGELPEMFGAQGYDGVKILAAAMQRANSTDPKVFRAALAQTKNFPGVSGTVTIRPNREPIKSPLCVLEVKGGKYVLKAKVPVKMD